jgi:hypothetical protein
MINRSALRRAAVGLLLLAGLTLAVLSVSGQRRKLTTGLAELSVGYVGAAAAISIVSLGFSLLAWRATLGGLGWPLPLGRAARIYFVGQLSKYVPGSVWPFVAQMELGAGYGLSRSAVGTAGLLTLAIAIPAALLLGLLAIPALLSADSSGYLWLFLALPVAVIVLSPKVLNPILDGALRLARRGRLPHRLDASTVLRVAVFGGAANLLLGVQAWLLARDLGAQGALAVPLAIGAFALANVAGLLAVPLPAGAGVREAVLVVSLSPILPAGQALLLALVSRVLLTVCDVAVAAGSARGVSRGTDITGGDDHAVRPSS